MYASINAVAVRAWLCKDCRFHMYDFMKVRLVSVFSYKVGHFEVRVV